MSDENSMPGRLLSLVLVLLLFFAGVLLISPERVEAETAYSYTRVYISGGGDITSRFNINGMTGLCQNGSKDSPSSGKATVKKLAADDIRTKLAYHYGYQKKWTSGEKGCRLARCFYFSWSGKYYHQSKSVIDDMVKTAKKVTVPEWFKAYSCFPTNDLQEFVAWKYSQPGKLYILKSSSDPRSLKTGKYSFKGIKYGVYSDKSCKKEKGVLTCDQDGKTDTVNLAAGTYYIKEISAKGNYSLRTTVYSCKVVSGKTVKKALKDTPVKAGVVLKKKFTDDSDQGYMDEQGLKEKFRFKFTNTSDRSISYSGETDGNGVLEIDKMLLGEYKVTEELTPDQLEHYEDVSKVKTIEVKSGEKNTVEISWENRFRDGQVMKISKRTGDGEPAGGFVFEVSGVTDEGEQFGPVEVTTDEDEADSAVVCVDDIEPGTYTVTEKMSDEQKKQYHEPRSQTKTIKEGDEETSFVFSFENIPKWTPVKLRKVSRDGCVEGIDFRITGTTDFGKEIDVSGITDKDGLVDFGNLYAGTYILEEVSFDPSMYENNYTVEGLEGRQCVRFTVTGEEEGTIWLGGKKGKGGEGTEFVNKPFAKLLVTKTDAETGQFLPGALFELRDENENTVALFSIDEEEDEEGNFVAVANILECIDGVSALPYSDLSTDDQEETSEYEDVSEEGSEEADASDSEWDDMTDEGDGSSELRFVVIQGLREDATYTLYEREAPAGYSVSEPVVIERLEDLEEVVVEDRKPSIRTTAHDSETGGNVSAADGSVKVIDTVYYSGVTPGEKYTVTGMLMDKTGITSGNAEDISAVVTEKGEVKKTVEITPDASEGMVDVVFTFDGSDLAGKDTVVYESLSKDGTEIATHMERDSIEQSIRFVEPEEVNKVPQAGEGFPWIALMIGVGISAMVYAAVNRKIFSDK